jgi:hypothetical protein
LTNNRQGILELLLDQGHRLATGRHVGGSE